MMEIHKNRSMDRRAKLLFTIPLGLFFIILPCILIFINPIMIMVNYRLRLANGTLLHQLLQQELPGPKLHFTFFNVSNADAFLAGEEDALSLKEVGPFVYQEYRINKDLEWNTEQGFLRYTPSHRTELVIEESVGRPEDFDLVMPNVVLLSAVQLLNKYPYFIRQLFKLLTSGMSRNPLTKVNAYKYLWDNSDPLISTINAVVPGLIYYNSSGILARFYDADVKYRLTVGTTDLDKFQVKTIRRFPLNAVKSGLMLESTDSYNNTYEGAAFPPQMTPDMPIELYRHRICKTLKLTYTGRKQTSYGSEAFVYNIANTTFNDHKVCDSKGWCPRGILDLSSCYNGFPFVLSKGHFLDTEPKLFEKVKGLKPNRSLHESTVIIDPTIGITLDSSISMQLSMAFGDMSLFKETKRLSDIFLPISQCFMKHPKMPEEALSILRLLYTYGPYMLISGQVLSTLLGATLLAYSVRCWRRTGRSKALANQCSLVSRVPLLK